MVGQGRRRYGDAQRNLTGRQAVRAFRDHQPEHRQSMLLSERGKRLDSGSYFHTSTLIELSKRVNSSNFLFAPAPVCR